MIKQRALEYAIELETAVLEIANGKRKPNNLPVEPVMQLIQFTKEQAALSQDATREPVGAVFYIPNDKYPKATFNTLDIPNGALLYTEAMPNKDADLVFIAQRQGVLG